jgi:hypothetical protein
VDVKKRLDGVLATERLRTASQLGLAEPSAKVPAPMRSPVPAGQRRRSAVVLAIVVTSALGCAGTMLAEVVAQRDAITAAGDDYPCPRHRIREISDNADPHERHWVYILNVCGVPHAYRDRAGQGGFEFVEIPMPADAGPAPLVLPPRAPEEDSDNGPAPAAAGAAIPDAKVLDAALADH